MRSYKILDLWNISVELFIDRYVHLSYLISSNILIFSPSYLPIYLPHLYLISSHLISSHLISSSRSYLWLISYFSRLSQRHHGYNEVSFPVPPSFNGLEEGVMPKESIPCQIGSLFPFMLHWHLDILNFAPQFSRKIISTPVNPMVLRRSHLAVGV